VAAVGGGIVKVAIADDHRIVREGIRWMLSDAPSIDIAGEADSGEALLELLASTSIDVALVDVRMSGMSGLEALGHVRDEFPQVRVIIL
jgi:DNA-binding NarL/FixJ family response regulator